ncbi:MAG: YggS family pyridoxal phosphate-dependent enzyme [Saprospiraceae bacterium]|nr:YggS family pyridoxal phosphate-dependent enzyme [Saprospiraceae bacterium]
MIADYHQILKQCELNGAKLLVVSKNQSPDSILKIYKEGQRLFAENKVQSLLKNQQSLPKDINWHLIGHLQSNKVKDAVEVSSLIHSLDSFKLAQTIHKESIKQHKTMDLLIQIKISNDQEKSGFLWEDLIRSLEHDPWDQLDAIRIKGVMGIGSIDALNTRQEFKTLYSHFTELKKNFFQNKSDFTEVSMGMSSDYLIALEEGATMIRVGSVIFEGG